MRLISEIWWYFIFHSDGEEEPTTLIIQQADMTQIIHPEDGSAIGLEAGMTVETGIEGVDAGHAEGITIEGDMEEHLVEADGTLSIDTEQGNVIISADGTQVSSAQ